MEGCKKKNDDGGQESAPKIIGNLKKNHTYYFVVGPFSDEYGNIQYLGNVHIQERNL